jgi:hypothetical protein
VISCTAGVCPKSVSDRQIIGAQGERIGATDVSPLSHRPSLYKSVRRELRCGEHRCPALISAIDILSRLTPAASRNLSAALRDHLRDSPALLVGWPASTSDLPAISLFRINDR